MEGGVTGRLSRACWRGRPEPSGRGWALGRDAPLTATVCGGLAAARVPDGDGSGGVAGAPPAGAGAGPPQAGAGAGPPQAGAGAGPPGFRAGGRAGDSGTVPSAIIVSPRPPDGPAAPGGNDGVTPGRPEPTPAAALTPGSAAAPTPDGG